jgi:hypothetical protein
MAKPKFTYLHAGEKKVPEHTFATNHVELRQQIRDALWMVKRVKVRNLYPLIDLLPSAAAKRLVRAAIDTFMSDPKARDPKLLEWFHGRLYPMYPLSPRIAAALGAFLETEAAQVSEHERISSCRSGYPDPKGLARDFFTLVGSRVAKTSWSGEQN